MLCKAKSKVANADIELVLAEAERLPFSDSTFDCAITGFALRNVADVEKTLHEMARVVKVKGKVVCLEITQPPKGLFRKIYRFYLSILLPFLGGLISRNRDAYAYLPQSIIEFYSPEKLRQIMEEAGLKDIQIHPLTLGIASVWVGTKGGR
jgi:demethylmenaquinone methyltransferase/2-methoxy-6-polyprenyl-1,4-benzoquinol methylase